MRDTLTKSQRSYCMSQIRSKNTIPEVTLRKEIWSHNLRGFRLKTKVYGNPDIVFTKNKVVIFIDGCFWHKCPKCYIEPKSNRKYWLPKLDKNIARDREVTSKLRREGYAVIRFWEHQVKNNPLGCINQIKKAIKKNGGKKA